MLVAVDDRSALVATAGSFYDVSPDGIKRLDLPASLPNLAGFRSQSGELYLLGAEGNFVRGTPENGFARVGTPTGTPHAKTAAALDGWDVGESLEIYAATDAYTVQRFDGAGWSAPTPCPNGMFSDVMVARFLGGALAIFRPEQLIWALRNTSYAIENPPVESGDSPSAVGGGAGRALVGTAFGHVLTFDGTSWEDLGNADFEQPEITSLSESKDEVFFAGLDGHLGRFSRDLGFCPLGAPNPPTAQPQLIRLVAMKNGLVSATLANNVLEVVIWN
jgi:hypothetical protein